jgi:catalase
VRSAELSILANPLNATPTIATRKIAMLVADGVDGDHIAVIKAALMAAGATAELVAPTLSPIKAADGAMLQPDTTFLIASSVLYDAVFVPGGAQSVAALRGEGSPRHFINEAFVHCKTIAAAADGLDLLLASNIIDPVANLSQLEAALAQIPGVVTERSPKDLQDLALRFIDAIAIDRHFDRPQRDRVPA